jgi:hypothetical protein
MPDAHPQLPCTCSAVVDELTALEVSPPLNFLLLAAETLSFWHQRMVAARSAWSHKEGFLFLVPAQAVLISYSPLYSDVKRLRERSRGGLETMKVLEILRPELKAFNSYCILQE